MVNKATSTIKKLKKVHVVWRTAWYKSQRPQFQNSCNDSAQNKREDNILKYSFICLLFGVIGKIQSVTLAAVSQPGSWWERLDLRARVMADDNNILRKQILRA
jgi:hypothetical protein